jgi:hypothetical protein
VVAKMPSTLSAAGVESYGDRNAEAGPECSAGAGFVDLTPGVLANTGIR